MSTKIQWTPEMDAILRDGYSTRFNSELAQDCGVSVRSVIRRLRKLGLSRPEDFNLVTAKRRASLFRKGKVGAVNPGCIKPGEHRNPAGEFGNRVVSHEARVRGARKGAEKRKETFKRERMRVKYGLPQKTRMNVNEPSRRSNYRRSYLRRFGYHIEKGAYVAYYDDNTQRRPLMEARCRNIEFKPLTTINDEK